MKNEESANAIVLQPDNSSFFTLHFHCLREYMQWLGDTKQWLEQSKHCFEIKDKILKIKNERNLS